MTDDAAEARKAAEFVCSLGAERSAYELTNPEQRRGYRRTQQLAAHVASVLLFELDTINAFFSDEIDARKREETSAAERLHAAQVAAARVTTILRMMRGAKK